MPHRDPNRFETILSRLSATFIHLPAEEVDGQIERGLGQIVAYLGIERSSLGQFSADGRELIVTHNHTAASYPPMPRVDLAAMWPWYVAQIRAGRILRFARLPEGLPPEAEAEREACRRGGLPLSHLVIPFRVGEAVLGGIGFGSYLREIHWSDELVLRLQLLGEVFANALARKVALEKESRLREQLALAARVVLMGELTASIAHEINQPLCALLTGSQALQRVLSADAPALAVARGAARQIAADAVRASDIITRIRTLFQAEPLETAALDLNGLIRELVALMRGEMSRREVTVRLALDDRLPPARGDRNGLRQVIVNLMHNAADALAELPAERRFMQVGTARDGDAGLLAWVHDDGPGLDPRHVGRVFDAFFTTKPGGTGMGLAVCKSIVERHAGRVWAVSEPGGGTTVHFYLPSDAGAP